MDCYTLSELRSGPIPVCLDFLPFGRPRVAAQGQRAGKATEEHDDIKTAHRGEDSRLQMKIWF